MPDTPAPRWNDFARVYAVTLDGEHGAQPRLLRASSPALRVGDPVQVTERGRIVVGVIERVESSVIHVSSRRLV